MTGGRVRRFVRNLVGYAMGDPWDGQQPTDAGDSPSGSGQGQHSPHSHGDAGSNYQHDSQYPGHQGPGNPQSQSHPSQQYGYGDGTPTGSASQAYDGFNPEHSPQNLSTFNCMPRPHLDHRNQDPTAARANGQPGPHNHRSSRGGDNRGRESTPSVQSAPVLMEAAGRNGGIQGFRWYASELLRDGDGDVACSFLEESPKGSSSHTQLANRGSSSVHPVAAGSAGWGTLGKGPISERGSSAPAPMREVPKMKLRPMEFCPAVCCVRGNLAHVLGPSREMVFV